jgi:hypothetical protein
MFWDQESSGGVIMSRMHPSHVTRSSDSSYYDEVCIHCGDTDIVPGGWGKLSNECPAEPEQHRVARLLGASREFVNSTLEKI